MEHRCGYRRAVNVPVVVRAAGGLVGRCTLCEISASGARLATSLPLPLESLVEIRFASVRGARGGVTIEAEVVRRTENGFGLEWTEFAPEAARSLFAPADESGLDIIPPAAIYRQVKRG